MCSSDLIIDGTQCTIGWYVDDNKISHADPIVVSNIIAHIEAKFGKMTVTRGKHHTFLGMDLTFNDDCTLTIKMADYVRATLTDSGINLSPGGVSTPAKKNLFELDTQSPALDPTRADTFHRIVAKLLYLAKRGRSDILLRSEERRVGKEC